MCRPDTAAGKRYYAERARSLLDESRPGLHNQAVMEFGALQCVPANPDCECCPLRDRCLSLARGTVADRPPKREKKAAVPRYFNYLHVRCAGSTLLAKRTGRDIWRNLYEFPLIETPRAVDFGELRGRLGGGSGSTRRGMSAFRACSRCPGMCCRTV